MATSKIIRKNVKTNEWEYFVPVNSNDAHPEEHWSPGLFGNDDLDVKNLYDKRKYEAGLEMTDRMEALVSHICKNTKLESK